MTMKVVNSSYSKHRISYFAGQADANRVITPVQSTDPAPYAQPKITPEPLLLNAKLRCYIDLVSVATPATYDPARLSQDFRLHQAMVVLLVRLPELRGSMYVWSIGI